MYAGSFAMLSLFLMLMLENTWAHGNENCTISVQRGTKHTIKAGVSFSIKCPVMDCQENLTINWYRNGEILPQGQRHNISREGHDFVLHFSPISKNDSGRYQCQATMGKSLLSGHEIEVIVQESENAAAEDNEAAGKDMKLIIYFLSFLGPLCLFILSCLGLLCCIRKHQVNSNKGPSISQSEMNVLNSNADAQCSNVSHTIPALHQAAEPYVLQFPDNDPIYGNQCNCWNATRAPPKPTCDECVSNTQQLLPQKKEALIYATLSYGEPVQRHEHSAETEFTEYAAIGLNH
nr:B- and T-lymphocyte attenuator [Zootoca vivipara]